LRKLNKHWGKLIKQRAKPNKVFINFIWFFPNFSPFSVLPDPNPPFSTQTVTDLIQSPPHPSESLRETKAPAMGAHRAVIRENGAAEKELPKNAKLKRLRNPDLATDE
jgi:hypothetical protein